MKILHVLYSGLGGHGNIFFSMVNADTQKEFEYEALFFDVEKIRAEFIEQCNNKNIRWSFAKKKFKLDLAYHYKILQKIRSANADIIFLHGSAHILAAKFATIFSGKKRKIIIRETQANHLKTSAQWVSLATAMFLANRIVCLTDAFKSQIQKKLGGLFRKKKVVIIPNGIDLGFFKPGSKIESGEICIGMQSRLVIIKDHLTLIKAFAILKNEQPAGGMNLKLKIAGEGSYKEALVSCAAELGIADAVEFTGALDEEDLVVFLRNLDIYVHASLGETMSTAIMQAMACKLPVIASDVDGINNMITGRTTGLLVPAQNVNELENAIMQCIADPDLRKSLAENAYEYALRHFSNQNMVASYKNIFL
jgi:glycosyltransferase involved in cell wall biosynthesis